MLVLTAVGMARDRSPLSLSLRLLPSRSTSTVSTQFEPVASHPAAAHCSVFGQAVQIKGAGGGGHGAGGGGPGGGGGGAGIGGVPGFW
jgi:hypothetical protein